VSGMEYMKQHLQVARKVEKDMEKDLGKTLNASTVGHFALAAYRACAALHARIAELERQPFAYDGPHASGKTYHKGTFVTHAGGLWHANYTTASKPGDGPAWTLAVKRGQDGKDTR
jgi:hypothetical protein